MSNQISKLGAPSFVIYFTGLSFIYFLTASLASVLQSFSEGTSLANQLLADSLLLGGAAVITLPEIFFLRRNLRLLGGLGSGVAIESIKMLSSTYLLQTVSPQLFYAFSVGSLGSILVAKIFRERIDSLSKTNFSKNVLNVVPSLFFLLALTGGSLLTTLGFGAASQIEDPKFFDTSDYDGILFNKPSWNAAYYLQNLMDQFTAGLNAPFEAVFNVTRIFPDNNDLATTSNHYPFAYYKKGLSDTWEYDPLKAQSGDWDLSSREALRYGVDQILSSPIPQSYIDETTNINPTLRNNTVVTLKIEKDINTTGSTWRKAVPVAWSGNLGAYINPSTINLGGSSCISLGPNCAIYENVNKINSTVSIPQNIELSFSGLSGLADETRLTWEQDYLTPNYLKIQQSALPPSLYELVLGTQLWQQIQDKYTQVPTGTGLPSIALTSNGPNTPITSYSDWSPLMYSWRDQVNANLTPSDSVFNIALAYAQSIAPTNYGDPDARTFTIGQDEILLDQNSWIGQFTEGLTSAPHPDNTQNEEYVEWFFKRGGGIGIHFASALAMMLRSQGIPTRLVDGYAGGNTTIDPDKTVMQAQFRHAWVEVLVPMRNPISSTYYTEWVIFDPVATLFIGQTPYGNLSSQTQAYFVDPYQYATGSTDIRDIYGNMTYRVGIDYKHDIGGGNWVFDGVYDRSTESKQTLYAPFTGLSNASHVKVGVFTSAANKIGDIPGSFYPIPFTQVTFALARINSTNNKFLISPWGPSPNDPNNFTNVYSVPITSNINGLAETEFIYNFTLHGTSNFNFVAMYGNVFCTATNDCLNNVNTRILAISDNDVLAREVIPDPSGDGDVITIDTGTFTATNSPVWSPVTFEIDFGLSDDGIQYDSWQPTPLVRQSNLLFENTPTDSISLFLNNLENGEQEFDLIQDNYLPELSDLPLSTTKDDFVSGYLFIFALLGLLVKRVVFTRRKELTFF